MKVLDRLIAKSPEEKNLMTKQELFALELKNLLPIEAFDWLMKYQKYCNAIDDIIDEPKFRNDNEFIIGTFLLSAELFSDDFYQKYKLYLFPTNLLITNCYADSVKFEQKNSQEWQKKISDVIRCSYSMMVIQVLYIFVGYAKVRELSPKLQECGWDHHHTLDGKPI